MASYKIVDQVTDIQPALANLREGGEGTTPPLTVDCEGDILSRKGVLSIVSVATESHTYLFDIKALGARVFDDGLREILEDSSREKLMFDCRADSDCLWHRFKVKLANVLDLQLMQFIYEETHPVPRPAGAVSKAQIKNFQPKLRGFLKCLVLYVKDDQLTKAKADGKPMMDEEGAWMERPLGETLLAYAAADVQGFFPLYRALRPGLSSHGMARVQAASQRFLDFYRSLAVRTYNKFEKNAYLPWRLLQPSGSYLGEVACAGCKRRFPRVDFLPYHLRTGTPNCPVCRKLYAVIARELQTRVNTATVLSKE